MNADRWPLPLYSTDQAHIGRAAAGNSSGNGVGSHRCSILKFLTVQASHSCRSWASPARSLAARAHSCLNLRYLALLSSSCWGWSTDQRLMFSVHISPAAAKSPRAAGRLSRFRVATHVSAQAVIARAVLIDRTAYAEEFEPRWTVIHLFEARKSFSLKLGRVSRQRALAPPGPLAGRALEKSSDRRERDRDAERASGATSS